MTHLDGQAGLSLIENMSYVVIAVDQDGVINGWNKAAEWALGFAASEALGQHANLLIPKNMQQAHGHCFAKSLGMVKPFAVKKDVVLPFMHKSGVTVQLKGHTASIIGADGLPQGSAVIGSKVDGEIPRP